MLLLSLVAIGSGSCGQSPRLDVSASIDEGGRVVFDVPRRGVNGLLGFRVEDEAGKVLWDVSMSYEQGRRITFGVLPTEGNMKARQIVPADGSAPPDIRGRRVRVRVGYQYDELTAASAASFEKTIQVP
jgi:hypothetical protein